MGLCVYLCEYMCICVHYYRLVIKYHQLILQANNYVDLWLHSHQQSKQANKQKQKKSIPSVLHKQLSVFGVILVRIQSECGKMRTRIASDPDTFHRVLVGGGTWSILLGSQRMTVLKSPTQLLWALTDEPCNFSHYI